MICSGAGVKFHGHPDVDLSVREYPIRHDADDRTAFCINVDRPAKNIRITAESPLPQAMAEEDDFGFAGLVFLLCIHTPEDRLYPQSGSRGGRRVNAEERL